MSAALTRGVILSLLYKITNNEQFLYVVINLFVVSLIGTTECFVYEYNIFFKISRIIREMFGFSKNEKAQFSIRNKYYLFPSYLK